MKCEFLYNLFSICKLCEIEMLVNNVKLDDNGK